MNSHFALDKANGRMLGVCAGLARTTGWDPTLVRLGAVAAALIAGPVILLFYVVAGFVAEAR